MPDVSLADRTVVTAPKDYTISGSQALMLKAVHAEVDGSGAAAEYLPVLELVSPAGDVMWQAFDVFHPVAAGGSATVSWFHLNRPTALRPATVLQAFVSSVFPNPSGFDYATATNGASQFDYWVGFDFAVDAGAIGNLSTNGCEHFVFEGSPTTPLQQYVTFGINEPFPPGTVPTFELTGRNDYTWFGGPTVAADTWYRLDLHVVYDTVGLTFNPTLFIDGVNQNVPLGHSLAPGPIPGDLNFFFGTDQFCGNGHPSTEELTWLENITVGTTMGGSEIADLTTVAALQAAIAAGEGDNPAASLSVLNVAPF